MRYVNSEMKLTEIARDLGVRYIVEGSVRRVANHVRVTVQLIDASNDTHLWANNYDRELIDVFATQSAVAKEISNSLHLEIQPETVGKLSDMPTHSDKAYDLYIKAKSIDRSDPESETSMSRQIELLEQAVQIDPNFVEAWGYLNEAYDHSFRNINSANWFGGESEAQKSLLADFTEKAKRSLDKSIALDLDPLHARIISGSLIHFEQSEDTEMATLLFERLDKSLGKASLDQKLTRNYNKFLDYKTPAPGLNGNFANIEVYYFIFWAVRAINAHTLSGSPEKAQSIARQALIATSTLNQPNDSNSCVDARNAQAHWTLGEFEETRSIANRLIEQRSERYNAYGLEGFAILSLFDVDQAAKLFLE